MDYSLVVGVDADRRELVVGIVDYIRTFTWCVPCPCSGRVAYTVRDKKLESWVKDSAFLGGAGKGEPTIVTPKQCTLLMRRRTLDVAKQCGRQSSVPRRDGEKLLPERT